MALVIVAKALPFVLKWQEGTGLLQREASTEGPAIPIRQEDLWVGWPGVFSSDGAPIKIPESHEFESEPRLPSKQVVAVDVAESQFESFSSGCCERALRPLLHSLPGRVSFSADHWNAYVGVNQLYAHKTIQAVQMLLHDQPLVRPVVWIHGHHLMLAGRTVRTLAGEQRAAVRLGFALHAPFPPRDTLRLLPTADQLLCGLLGCDLVVFQTRDYCLNFVDCCRRQLGCRVDRNELSVQYDGRSVAVRALAMGVPFDRFQEMARRAPRDVRDSRRKIILSVGRLDCIRDLAQRLRPFQTLLEKHGGYAENVTLVHVAAPWGADADEDRWLRADAERLVDAVNDRYAAPGWTPVRFVYGPPSQPELAALYRDADVLLAAAACDDAGDATAQQFVACRVDEPGVLILAPFAAGAATLPQALLANPHDCDAAAETLRRALEMPLDERELRMAQLRHRVKKNDADACTAAFLDAIGDSAPSTASAREEVGDDDEDFASFVDDYLGDDFDRLALLLDYDGTLAPIATRPDLAVLPDATRAVLQRLCRRRDVDVAVISGRAVADVKEMVAMEEVTYAGSHGLDIVHPDGTAFSHPMPDDYPAKIATLLHLLRDRVCRYGAWVEDKKVLLTFHYRETPTHLRQELIDVARRLIGECGFKCVPAHCALEAKPQVHWNKGRAALYILRHAYGLDWNDRVRVIFVGDDVTDEDAMRSLKGMAASFRVAADAGVETSADRRLADTDAVLRLLEWIERRLNRRR